MMLMQYFSDSLYISICCWYSFALHRQVETIQMRTNNTTTYAFIKDVGTHLNCHDLSRQFK